jgi:flagellar basal-body rod modification protein FlgD
MYKVYTENMTDRAKSLMDKNYVTTLMQYVNRIDELREDDLRTSDGKS